MRVGGALALVAILAGCALGPAEVSGSRAPSAPVQNPPAPELASFYGQELTWQPCDGVECATLRVPVDYEAPAGPTLDIAVLRTPAVRSTQGVLVVNPGGPGASGWEYARAARAIVTDRVREAYDIVGFDPRGVGRSAPVDCVEDADLDRLIAMDATPDTPGEVRDLERAAAIQPCSAPVDGLVDHLSTADTARDLDVLRAALGQNRLDYLGVSYGTHLGATYAALFPERVGRFVLDGPLPADLNAEELTLGQAIGFEHALERFVEYCSNASDCPLGDDAVAGMQRLRDLLDQLDARPAPTANPDRPLTEAAATYAILLSLYRVQDRPLLRDALGSLIAGDGAPLQRMMDERTGRQSDGSYRDNAMDAFYAVSCRERAVPDDIPASVERVASAAPVLGEYLAWGNLSCRGASPVDGPLTAPGTPTVLVIATTHDPATPIAWAEPFVAQFDEAVLVVREGDGHTGYREGSGCVDNAVDAFLLDGTLPGNGVTCD